MVGKAAVSDLAIPPPPWPTWEEVQDHGRSHAETAKRGAEEEPDDAPAPKRGGASRALDAVTEKLAEQYNAGDAPDGVFDDDRRQPADAGTAGAPARQHGARLAAKRYRDWRHVMDANKRFVEYYSDPLPSKNTEVHIAFEPTPYTVRVNNRVTHMRLEDALLEGRVLYVPHLETSHIDSVDALLCWKLKDGRVGAHVDGEAMDKTYAATKGVSDIHTAVADTFGGWHHSRATEHRQTAHALLCGPLHTTVRESIPADAAVDAKAFPGDGAKVQHARYEPFAYLQSLCDALVADYVVIVKGPGRDAAGTPCRVRAVKQLSEAGHRVISEADSLLQAMRVGLPRRPPENCLSKRYEGRPLPSVATLLLRPTLKVTTARVLTEVALMDSVRAGAGKRYHHGLPVRAGQIALRTACRDLLLASVDQ